MRYTIDNIARRLKRRKDDKLAQAAFQAITILEKEKKQLRKAMHNLQMRLVFDFDMERLPLPVKVIEARSWCGRLFEETQRTPPIEVDIEIGKRLK